MSRLTPVYLITVVLSACSLLYELIIAQTISSLAANTVVWYSVTVGLYMGSLGLGALLYRRRLARNTSIRALYWTELWLTIAGAAAPLLIYCGHVVFGYLLIGEQKAAGLIIFFGIAVGAIIVVGMLTGAELPLLIRLAKEASGTNKNTNRVLFADYSGALIGALAFPLLLLPRFELLTISLLTAAVNLSVALMIQLNVPRTATPTRLERPALAAVALMLLVGLVSGDQLQQLFLKKYYYYNEPYRNLSQLLNPLDHLPKVERFSSPYQKIDVVRTNWEDDYDTMLDHYSDRFSRDGNFPRSMYLFLNGDQQFFTNSEVLYHEYGTHIPIILNNQVPKRVLILGGGDGLIARELLKYPQIEKITQVDLDPEMIRLARTHPMLRKLNSDALEDPRVQIVIGDAFQFVRRTEQRFDAIFLDFPVPVDYNLSKLYSTEFYQFVGRRLNDDGFVLLDATRIGFFSKPNGKDPQHLTPRNEWAIFYNTLRDAGFATLVPYVWNLEVENPGAIQELLDTVIDRTVRVGNRDVPATKEERESAARARIREFIWLMQEGFIMAKKGTRPLPVSYHEPGVPLDILNEERFRLAFALDFPTPQQDRSKVNSIMHPVLPTLPAWHVRTPY